VNSRSCGTGRRRKKGTALNPSPGTSAAKSRPRESTDRKTVAQPAPLAQLPLAIAPLKTLSLSGSGGPGGTSDDYKDVRFFIALQERGLRAIADAGGLGLTTHENSGDSLATCPACRARRRKKDERGPVRFGKAGRRWKCSRCGESGAAVELACWLVIGEGSPDDYKVARERCTMLRLCSQDEVL
jgi:hypothetical protein